MKVSSHGSRVGQLVEAPGVPYFHTVPYFHIWQSVKKFLGPWEVSRDEKIENYGYRMNRGCRDRMMAADSNCTGKLIF